jgi:hypothetical protein
MAMQSKVHFHPPPGLSIRSDLRSERRYLRRDLTGSRKPVRSSICGDSGGKKEGLIAGGDYVILTIGSYHNRDGQRKFLYMSE